MNAEAERELLAEYLRTCARLNEGFVRSYEGVAHLMPMTADRIDRLSYQDDSSMLSFLKRYEQFEDSLHRTIKVIVQVMEFGKVQQLTARDVANHAERLGVVADSDAWADAVRIRNALTHEYPLRPDKRAAQVNNAWNARNTLEDVWRNIGAFVAQEKLI